MVKASTIITSYNKAAYIRDAIKSALNQTIADIEVIVVDDRSTDNSVAIIESIRDTRLKLIRLSQNVGLSAARNIGIAEARGEYIQILDGDDTIAPQKIERQQGHDVSYCNFEYLVRGKLKNAQDGHYGARPDLNLVDAHNDFLNRWEKGLSIAIHAFMYRREVLDAVGLFDESLPNHEDWDLHLRVSKEYLIHYVPETMATYRVVPNSMTRDKALMAEGFQAVIARWT